MGFLFDSLRHLLAREPEARREALASMIGRVLKVSPVRLSTGHPTGSADAAGPGVDAPGAGAAGTADADADATSTNAAGADPAAPDPAGAGAGQPSADPQPTFGIWHAPKVSLRPFAVTWTVGLAEAQGRELIGLTLADSTGRGPDRFAALLAAVAAAGTGAGETLVLPEGTLGRSSHTRALVVAGAWPLTDEAEYARILGAPLHLVVPVTAREAAWIEAHSAQAYVDAMKAQEIAPWADRAPGEARLP